MDCYYVLVSHIYLNEFLWRFNSTWATLLDLTVKPEMNKKKFNESILKSHVMITTKSRIFHLMRKCGPPLMKAKNLGAN